MDTSSQQKNSAYDDDEVGSMYHMTKNRAESAALFFARVCVFLWQVFMH